MWFTEFASHTFGGPAANGQRPTREKCEFLRSEEEITASEIRFGVVWWPAATLFMRARHIDDAITFCQSIEAAENALRMNLLDNDTQDVESKRR